MSTVKISQLPDIPGGLNANTSNSLFLGVDIPTGVTGKFTATQLAERLYANNVLNVGDNPIVLPNVVAQFAGDAEEYLQINLFNSTANGSADYVVTADTGTDATYYVDFGINNSDYGTGALDGYLIVAGDGTGDPGGNLMLGSITSGKQIEFVIGGFESANVVAKMVDDIGLTLTKKPIIFADGTTQNTAAATASFSQQAFAAANTAGANTVAINTLARAAYGKANAEGSINNTQNTWITNADTLATAAYGKANAEGTINTTQNTNIAAVNTFAYMASFAANSAWTKANNSLANTTGTFGGTLTIANNLNVNGVVYIANSGFSATQAALTISATSSVTTPSNDGYMLHISGKENVPSRLVADSYGANTYVVVAGRTARGNVSYPSAVSNNDVLMRISGNGYGATGFAPLGVGRIDVIASENHTDSVRGSRIEFWNVPTGSNTLNKIAIFNGDSASFTGVVNPQKGFVYTPNNITVAATTHTIDFQRDSMVRFVVNDNATISLQNYVHGKIVEVWITNSAAQNKTITHGCFANSSTSQSTTFTIQAQGCAYLKYFSIDGDLANTFVSITA